MNWRTVALGVVGVLVAHWAYKKFTASAASNTGTSAQPPGAAGPTPDVVVEAVRAAVSTASQATMDGA